MNLPISTLDRTIPRYEFRGVQITIYKSGNRYSAQFIGLNRTRVRIEKNSESEALEAAKNRIRKLNDPEVQQSLGEQKTAEEIVNGSGISLIEAARSVVSAQAKLQPLGATLSEAVDYYVSSHEGRPITVAALIDEYLTVKTRDTGLHHVRSIRSRLKHHFAKDFGDRSVGTIKAEELNRWIASLPVASRTRANYYSALVSLFEFAKDNGYLPKGKPSEMQLIRRPRAGRPRIEVLTPEELAQLIKMALRSKSRALPALLIQCLSGVRHEEVQQSDPKKDRLRWSDVWLDQTSPEIHVRSEVSKIGKERFIPLHPSLIGWLRKLHLKGNVPVYAWNALGKDYAAICRQSGVRWKKNGPRKSFTTYDAALTRSLETTSKAAGNSPGMIRRFYKKELSQVGQVALEWFSLAPRQFTSLLKCYLNPTKNERKYEKRPTKPPKRTCNRH